MPQIEIDVSCPGCGAVFLVPVTLCGEMAECTECSAVFEIPGVGEVPSTLNTDTGAVKTIRASDGDNGREATNTVKLSRASIGMIPSMKDNFNFGQDDHDKSDPEPSFPDEDPLEQSSTPAQPKLGFVKPTTPPPPPPAKPMAVSAHTATSQQQTVSSTQTSLPAQQIAQPVKLPSWTKIQLRQGEELQACRETKKNPASAAVLASLPVLLTMIAMFFAKTHLVLALVLVVILWIATFVIAFLMTRDSSNRAIVLTNQRTICIIGEDRIELKK